MVNNKFLCYTNVNKWRLFMDWNIFRSIVTFFETIGSLLTFDILFFIVLGLMVVLVTIVLIRCSAAYESKLIRSLDKLTTYLQNNPQIDESNLVEFNKKMKKVPHVLRKQWQQFMLYRNEKASYYMSFKHVVENPMRTSTYKQQVSSMNIVSYIFAFLSFLLACSRIYSNTVAEVLVNAFLLPFFILFINWLFTLFLNARYNAVTSDLFQNYQYFEISIDKAASSLPDYVDYEVLFTKKEIKQGIPILFEYLEKRSILEQQEMERARQRQIEHDKYKFDRSGIESALVLERSVHETEIFLANRSRLMQEIEQINAEINNIEGNFKEKNKDYQRKMQASKENIERLKAQLEQSASNIEANYIKKQQADELNRQLQLEKDFDTIVLTRKKDVNALQVEIEKREKEIDKAREALEITMESEFESYTRKVYDKVENVLKEQQPELSQVDNKKVEDLEAELKEKNRQIEILTNSTDSAQKIVDLSHQKILLENMIIEKNKQLKELKGEVPEVEVNEKITVERPVQTEKPVQNEKNNEFDFGNKQNDFDFGSPITEKKFEEKIEEKVEERKPILKERFFRNEFEKPITDKDDDDKGDQGNIITPEVEEEIETPKIFKKSIEEKIEKPAVVSPALVTPVVATPSVVVVETPKKRPGRPRKIVTEPILPSEPKRRGRPRKEVSESEVQPKRKPGRPRKVVEEVVTTEPKRRGRPRKEETTESPVEQPKKSRGRPRKVESVQVEQPKKSRGRPRKEVEDTSIDDIDIKLKELHERLQESTNNLQKVKEQLDVVVPEDEKPKK